ncbi:MAG: class I SAM-dependent methyltransferase [Bacillaceae bacterium]|nr:class I SAM-dependent methyltransferase [Bacillaceae bacterium]
MNYGNFAYIYDLLMEDAPYQDWVHFTEEMLEKVGFQPETIVDLGCGTGEITLRLAGKGFRMTGVDLSSDMLSVAAQKSFEQNLSIQWVKQDIRKLDTPIKYDLAISFCDVFNYLTEEEQLLNAFKRVFESLQEDGMFLFDVHSRSYINDFLAGKTFAEVYDEISYIWFCHPGELEDMVEHDLTFFLKTPNTGTYRRFQEYHVQRTFSPDVYKLCLHKSGFEVVGVYSDFQLQEPDDRSDRIFFVCRKKKNG